MTDQYSEDPSVSGMLRSRSLARQSGEYPTPPQREEMTRALPGYETRDPNELAMLRHREMVRPLAGRADVPIEHVANVANVGASMLPGMAIAKGIQAAPKITTGLGALYGLLAGTDKAEGQQSPDAIKQLQTEMQKSGLYNGPIDGVNGPATQRARPAYEKQQQDAQQQRSKDADRDLQLRDADARKKDADAREKDADARTAETERLRLKEEGDATRKREGDERMRDIEKNLSPTSRAIRDYSGPIGLAAGTILGGAARTVTQKVADKAIKEAATAGNAVMAEPTTGKKAVDVGISRAARVNDFATKGGAKEVPFTQTPTKAPGFEVNPNATPLKDLYSPQIHPAVELAAAAPAAIEAGVSTHYKGDWEEKLNAAQQAVAADPSEANIQALNTAKDNVALFTGLQRVGITSGAVQGVGAIGSRFMPKSPSMRPNMGVAETEQMSLQKMLREHADKTMTAGKKATKAEKPGLGMPANKQPAAGIPPAAAGPAAYMARTLHNY